MTEEEQIERTRTLIKRFDNMRIVGPGWAGNARAGFQFDAISAGLSSGSGGGSGGGPPPTGACCHDDGTCTIATPVGCSMSGGHYQGDGTNCGGVDCTHGGGGTSGACCVGTSCSITTPAGCSGTYLGDDTTCAGDPCGGGTEGCPDPDAIVACCHGGLDCELIVCSDCTGTPLGDVFNCDDPCDCLKATDHYVECGGGCCGPGELCCTCPGGSPAEVCCDPVSFECGDCATHGGATCHFIGLMDFEYEIW